MKSQKSKIKKITAREILDSRGNPTVEVELSTDSGIFRASVPSGASKGRYEAVELRDGGKRYHGRGVLKAINNVNKIIAPKLVGKDSTNQKEIDEILINLDGTENKSKLGANSICGVSLAVCRAGASAKNLSLWKFISTLSIYEINRVPGACFNIINGGAHAGNELDIQEFMIAPHTRPTGEYSSFSGNLRIASEIYQELKNIIKEKYTALGTNIGDEGGFAPPLRTSEEALNLILGAAENLGYQNKIKIILDVAASQFFEKNNYKMRMKVFSQEGLLKYYSDLIEKYPILGLEDPFSEDDWGGWQKIMSNVKYKMSNVLVIGDDLTVTNPKRIKLAKERKACNVIIIKPNQIGTVTEVIEAVKLAKSYGWKVIVSHRSGETCDDFISDLAVGIGADFIKTGAPARGERVAKYNRLLRIEDELK